MSNDRYLADLHTHSDRSPDASASMKDMAAAAVRAGLQELCFTDHVEPLVWGRTGLRGPYDWESWQSEFAAAQAAWGDQIRLCLGVELGDAVWAPEHCQRLLGSAPPLDFIIGSIHMLSPALGGADLYSFDPKDEAEARAGLADYLQQVRALAELGGFDVLGHLTLPLRYLNEGRGHDWSFDGFEAEIEEIFRILIHSGRGIELNTNRGNMPLPDEKWLRMYRSAGGEIITLGTDAHGPQHVGRAIGRGQELLRQCGFTRFCTFQSRQPVWHEL